MFRRRINYQPYIILMLVTIIIITVLFLDYKLKASIIEISRSKAQITVMENINSVINQQVVAKIEYKDIVDVHKDNQDRIVLIQPNTILLNKMMSNTIIEITQSLDKLSEESIEVPVGQITGSKILSGYGPRMKVKIISAGQIYVDVINKFEEAGINQTRHLIYFQINCPIKVAVPFLDEQIQVSTTVPLAETIIIGSVPETYVGLDSSKVPVYPFIKE